MLVFLDTEYSGLGQRLPSLISLALVPEDGKREFYAELPAGGYAEQCDYWVEKNVLPLLSGGDCVLTLGTLKEKLLGWFADMPRYIQIACDSETDFRFLRAILAGCWPKNLDGGYFDLRPLIDTTIYDKTVQRYYNAGCSMHNALADAQAYRLGWLAWMDANKGE